MVALAISLVAAAAGMRSVSVEVKGGKIVSFADGVNKSATAWGTFADDLNTTGWGQLNLRTNAAHEDADQAFAAGAVEGMLTAPRIWEHFHNMFPSHFKSLNSSELAAVRDFMTTQDAWTREQIKSNGDTPGFWRQQRNVYAQFDGLRAGYNAVAETKYPVGNLDVFDFQVLNSDGDFFQVVPAVVKRKRVDLRTLPVEEAELQLHKMGHCSAIIKVTGNFSDMFMGHSSWYTYAATNRIFKHYHFAFNADEVAAQRVSFSSYPGYLSSLDDFYMMDSGLGMVQTSIGFNDHSLYDLITPNSLMAWQRIRVAHVVAKTGEEWWQAAKTAFSGTYSNTYMVVDWKLFTPGQAIVPNTLWVSEEIPGQFPGADVSDVLAFGYWPSYNVPYFPQVHKASGFADLAAMGVPSASFQTAPRAKIFRRDEGKVVDLDSYKNILRYNAFETDPYAGPGLSCNAICCRGDLLGKGPSAFGCFDTKVTHAAWAKDLRASIVNGPTRGGDDDLPAFNWGKYGDIEHVGLPETYDFDFITTEPAQL